MARLTGRMTSSDNLSAPQSRLPLIDALRAVAANLITWHHIDLYGPLSHVATPRWTSDVAWNLSLAVQVFFVVGGYIMARTMSSRTWSCRDTGRFVARRYCRLVLPFLAAMVLAIGSRAAGRGWLPERVVDHPATWEQVLWDFVLLQDILGYQALSAGFWFIAIDFQLGVIYVTLLYVRDFVAWLSADSAGERANWLLLAAGWLLAAPAMFVFNLDPRLDIWAIYFFGPFFMGLMVYEGLKSTGSAVLFGLYVAMTAAALAFAWRWQLATALATAVALFSAGKLALMERWPQSRLVARLGLSSYSLFLVHFPVLVFVSTIWARLGYATVTSAVVASVAAYVASLAAAEMFYRLVESPAVALGAQIGRSRPAPVSLRAEADRRELAAAPHSENSDDFPGR
jgi:peptidoglycan/LPS O-acetylase OafA/YrhL